MADAGGKKKPGAGGKPKEPPADETTEVPGSDDDLEKRLDVVAPGQSDEAMLADKLDHHYDHSTITVMSNVSGTKREKWGSDTQFLMSCIASAVGLGNVWRFPAICAKNGGTSFFIPYMVVLFVIARPLFLLELALGQFSSKGSVRCWDLSPIFTGVGYTGSLSSVLLSSFYILLMCWSLIYTVLSFVSLFTEEVVWSKKGAGPYFGEEVLRSLDNGFNNTMADDKLALVPVCHLVLALLVAWIIIWITMVRGVEASGKVAYVTALAPYVVLITLTVVGFCLDGSTIGLLYLVKPDWNLLIDPKTWYEAVGQCFFSLGIGFGGLIMFSSFNDFHHNIFKDVVIISLVDFFTSVLAGISLMSILGFQARQAFEKNKNNSTALMVLKESCKENNVQRWVDEEMSDWLERCTLRDIVADGGAGLAFVHYPAAMHEISKKWGQGLGGFFGLLFFLMLILLAIGSANGFVGTTVTIISDKRTDWKRSNIVSGVCAASFLIGLIYTNRVGSEWIDVVDIHGVTAVVYILGFMEAVAVFGVYGLKNFCDDLEYMRNGKKIHWYFKITWALLPFAMLSVYVTWLVTYKRGKNWTTGIVVTAWILTVICITVMPAVAIAKAIEFKRNPWRKHVPGDIISVFKAICKPNPRWGPKDPEIRAGWKKFKAEREPSYNIPSRLYDFFTRKGGRRQQPLPVAQPSTTYSSAGGHPDNLNPPESGSLEGDAENINSVVGSAVSVSASNP